MIEAKAVITSKGLNAKARQAPHTRSIALAEAKHLFGAEQKEQRTDYTEECQKGHKKRMGHMGYFRNVKPLDNA